MKKLKQFVSNIPTRWWLLIILIVCSSEYYGTTIVEAKRLHATESLGVGSYDTTVAPRYAGGEFRYKSSDKTIYYSNGNTTGRKWYPIVRTTGPDTLVNLGNLDSVLMNPSTNKFGLKSIRTTSPDITVTSTIDANSIGYALTLAGALAADRKINGANHVMQWGDKDAASQVSEFRIDADKLTLNGSVVYGMTGVATDGNYVIPATVYNVELITITAGRNVTLPTGIEGKVLEIWNRNSAGFNWTFVGTVKDVAENAITTVVNDTYYRLKYSSNAAAWIKTN